MAQTKARTLKGVHIPTEASIVTSILTWLNAQPETHAVKTHGGMYSSGQPDITCVHLGRPFFLEVKRPGGKATPLQLRNIDLWRAAGAVAEIVTSREEAQAVIIGYTCGLGLGPLMDLRERKECETRRTLNPC